MTILHKAFRSEIKSAKDAEEGTFEAIVSTYDTDSVGDRVIPGAFAKTLKTWQDSGRSIPVIFSHQHDNPDAYMGEVLDAKETDAGLHIKAKVDLSHAPSKRVYDLMKSGRINQFSFAYEVKEGEFVQEKSEKDDTPGDEYFALKEMSLFEVGPCLIGANQNTQLLGAKRAEFKDEYAADVEVKTDAVTLLKQMEELSAKMDALKEEFAFFQKHNDTAPGPASDEISSDLPPGMKVSDMLTRINMDEISYL